MEYIREIYVRERKRGREGGTGKEGGRERERGVGEEQRKGGRERVKVIIACTHTLTNYPHRLGSR